MSILKVEEMHCEKCSERISRVLEAAGLDFSVNLADRTVTVNGDEASVSAAVSEMDDIGFAAVEIR